MGVEKERFAFQLLSQSSENNWDIHWSPTQGNLPLEPQYVSLLISCEALAIHAYMEELCIKSGTSCRAGTELLIRLNLVLV